MAFALQSYYQENHINRGLLGTAWREEDRARMIADALLGRDISNDMPPAILDVGCRDGAFMRQLKIRCRITGVDIDPNALLQYKLCFPDSNIRLADCNENLPFDNETFDVVIAGEIIEHLINPQLFLSEIKRILKPYGIFIGSTPNALRWDKRLHLLLGRDPKTFSDPTHTQYFSYDSLKNLLESQFSKAMITGHPETLRTRAFKKLFSAGFVWQTKK